jgi:hypothetical protein
MSLHVRLHSVADLCDADQQKLISTTSHELTGSWVNDPAASPTQLLGAALHARPDVEGILFPSSKAGSRNVEIFMDKLNKRSIITFENELDRVKESLI